GSSRERPCRNGCRTWRAQGSCGGCGRRGGRPAPGPYAGPARTRRPDPGARTTGRRRVRTPRRSGRASARSSPRPGRPRRRGADPAAADPATRSSARGLRYQSARVDHGDDGDVVAGPRPGSPLPHFDLAERLEERPVEEEEIAVAVESFAAPQVERRLALRTDLDLVPAMIGADKPQRAEPPLPPAGAPHRRIEVAGDDGRPLAQKAR